MFSRKQENSPKITQGPKRPAKIHSIAALPDGRDFVGKFDLGNSHYEFTYSPVKAEVAANKLVLIGKMTISGPSGRPHSRPAVRAVLASIQGGLGSPPPVYNGMARTAAIAASGNPGDTRPAASASADLPAPPGTDNTGAAAFCGVMYLHLEGLDGPSMGVPADLSHTQLNARLFATDELARKFHSLYSRTIAALFEGNHKEAGELIEDLNHLFKDGTQAVALPRSDWPLVEMGPPEAAPGR